MAKVSKKEERRKAAQAKARRKKIIIIVCIAAVVAVGVGFLISSLMQSDNAEVFSHGNQRVRLYDDGTFSANLPHGVRLSGTFTQVDEGDRVIVAFSHDGIVAEGFIENDSLHIPNEWDDGHGHANVFPRG